jgi:hypothetical protein
MAAIGIQFRLNSRQATRTSESAITAPEVYPGTVSNGA